MEGSFLSETCAHLKPLPVANRPEHRGHFHAKLSLDLVQKLKRAEAGPVHLVHESEDGQLPELAHLVDQSTNRPRYGEPVRKMFGIKCAPTTVLPVRTVYISQHTSTLVVSAWQPGAREGGLCSRTVIPIARFTREKATTSPRRVCGFAVPALSQRPPA